MSKSGSSSKGSTWDELEKQLFTSKEIEENKARVSIINKMIKAREENGITQNQLDVISDIKDGRIAGPTNGKIFDYRKMVKLVKSLGRPLTEEEAERYRIK